MFLSLMLLWAVLPQESEYDLASSFHWRGSQISLGVSNSKRPDEVALRLNVHAGTRTQSYLLLEEVGRIDRIHTIKGKYLELLIQGGRNLWWFRLSNLGAPKRMESQFGGDSSIVATSRDSLLILSKSPYRNQGGFYAYNPKTSSWDRFTRVKQ